METARTNAKPRIERAALTVFGRVGVDGATTKQIAAEAGVSEGALYRHFSGKEEMATALFMATHRRLADLIEEGAALAPDLPGRIRALVTAYCWLADEDWLRFSFHLLSLHRFLPAYQDDGLDPVSWTERLVAAAVAAKEIPPGDERLLAAMALGVITQTAQNKAYGRIDGPLSVHAPTLTAAVLAVLSARPATPKKA